MQFRGVPLNIGEICSGLYPASPQPMGVKIHKVECGWAAGKVLNSST